MVNKPVAWCWQDKAVLRRIREAFDADSAVCTALAVYLALTEIASDSKADLFKTTHGHIARLSGVSVSTVKNRLRTLAEIGLVDIKTPDLRAPSTYKLLPSANDYPTLANGCRALVKIPENPLATSEECTEEEKKKKTSPSASGRKTLRALFEEEEKRREHD
jgi:hypothetical protein